MAIKHAFVSGIADGDDTTLVRPSDWNAEHVGLKVIRKTADETVNNSTTLQNDDELLFAVAANEVWEFHMLARIISHETAEFQFAFTIPTGGSIKINTADEIGALPAHQLLLPDDGTSALYTASMATGFEYNLHIWGFYIGGANAGNVQFKWAQYVATAYNTKVLTNSFIIAHKLA